MFIPTLEDVLEEQKDLNALCADRDSKTKEIFRLNDFYGNDFILKAYAGVDIEYSLKFIIPHGIVFDVGNYLKAELKSRIPSIMCYQESRYNGYCERIGRWGKVFRAAAPFTYIPDLIKEKKDTERRGTLIFPSHSTRHLTAEMDYELLAEKILGLDEVYRPVTVCAYWHDYNIGAYEVFKKKGLKLVSAGHIFDPHFLIRLYHLLSQHEYSACNNMGSHIFYAQFAGCKHFFLNTGSINIKPESEEHLKALSNPSDGLIKKFNELYSLPGSAEDEKNLLLEKYLSPSLKKSKMGLRKYFIETEYIYHKSNIISNPLVGKIKNKVKNILDM